MTTNKNQNIKWWMKKIAYTGLFLGIAIFAYIKIHNVFTGINLKVSIRENAFDIIEIVGQAEHASFISINDREIFIDKEGNFTEKISLLPGFSIIKIQANDVFGNVSHKKFELFYKEKESVVLNSTIIN